MSSADRKSSSARALRVVRGGDSRAPTSKPEEMPAPNPADFDAVFRRYAPYVGSIALKILGRDEDVDDVIQEVFTIAHRGLPALREPAALKGWLGRIAVRRAQRRLKRPWWWRWSSETSLTDCESIVDPAATPEQRAEVAAVYEVLATMPVELRVAWVLRHVEGEKLEQVAVLCGCSLSTTQRRLRTAAIHLERTLGK